MSELEQAYQLVNQIGPQRYMYLGVCIQKLPITELYYIVEPGTEEEDEKYLCAEIDLFEAMSRIESMKF